jgi:hypothetical protein
MPKVALRISGGQTKAFLAADVKESNLLIKTTVWFHMGSHVKLHGRMCNDLYFLFLQICLR